MSITPNWAHHSRKDRKSKGVCKAQLKARRQALRALQRKLNASNSAR